MFSESILPSETLKSTYDEDDEPIKYQDDTCHEKHPIEQYFSHDSINKGPLQSDNSNDNIVIFLCTLVNGEE